MTMRLASSRVTSVSSLGTDTRAIDWIESPEMALALGVSIKTLHNYRRMEGERRFLKEGRHYRRSTPHPKSRWHWDRELTLKAWAAASGKGVQA